MTKNELSNALRTTSNNMRADSAERQATGAPKEIAAVLIREIDEYMETYQERTEVSRTERERVAYESIMIRLEAMKEAIKTVVTKEL